MRNKNKIIINNNKKINNIKIIFINKFKIIIIK
jgi:hypothetical protein